MSVVEGRQAVMEVAEICESLNYSVFIPSRETCTPIDMLVNGFRVQVKARGQDTSKPKNIRLRTNDGPAAIAYPAGSFDWLVLRWKGQWFVIPEHVLRVGNGVRNGIYMPQVGEWANRWDAMAGNRVVHAAQRQFEW